MIVDKVVKEITDLDGMAVGFKGDLSV